MTPAALKRIRKDLGLTQVAFAERIGIASNTLARMERGELNMKTTTEIAIKAVAAEIAAEKGKKR